MTDITDTIACKRVENLETVTLDDSKIIEKSEKKLMGESCQWVDLSKAVPNNMS